MVFVIDGRSLSILEKLEMSLGALWLVAVYLQASVRLLVYLQWSVLSTVASIYLYAVSKNVNTALPDNVTP